MGLISKILGVKDIVAEVGDAIDKNITSDEERMELLKKWDEIQTSVNIEEIKQYGLINRWRTAIGWVCAISLGTYFIPQYLVATWMWVKMVIAQNTLLPYPVGADGLMELTLGLLGLSGIKAWEKSKGLRNK